MVRGVHEPPDPRLRRRGREPERRGRARHRHPRVHRRPLGLRLRHRPRARPGCGRWPRPPTRPPRWPTRTSTAGCPDENGQTEAAGLESPAMADVDHRAQGRAGAGGGARGARSAEGVSQVENAVYSDAEGAAAIANSRGFSASYASTQAWAYASAFAGEGEDLMTGLGMGLGRDPGRARRRGDRRRGGRQGAGARGRAPAAEPPLPGGARRVRGRLVRRLHRGDALRRRRAARPLAVRRARGRGGGRARRSCWSTTARTPTGPASAPFDGEGSATRRTPLIEGGRARRLPLRRAHRPQGRPRRPPRNAGRGSYRSPPSVGTTNLLVEPGEATLEELVARPARAST